MRPSLLLYERMAEARRNNQQRSALDPQIKMFQTIARIEAALLPHKAGIMTTVVRRHYMRVIHTPEVTPRQAWTDRSPYCTPSHRRLAHLLTIRRVASHDSRCEQHACPQRLAGTRQEEAERHRLCAATASCPSTDMSRSRPSPRRAGGLLHRSPISTGGGVTLQLILSLKAFGVVLAGREPAFVWPLVTVPVPNMPPQVIRIAKALVA